MPGTTITINREQRCGLYELVRNHLGSVGDLFDALERKRDLSPPSGSAWSSGRLRTAGGHRLGRGRGPGQMKAPGTPQRIGDSRAAVTPARSCWPRSIQG